MDTDNISEFFEKYKYYIFSILVLFLLSNTFRTMAQSNYTVQQLANFDTVTIQELDTDAIFRINSITNTYDENGKLSYTVSFRIDGYSQRIECNIPESMFEVLDREAMYTGTIKLGYFKEAYEFIIEQEGSTFESVEDAVENSNAAREIIGIDFMFNKYLTTELITTDELKDKYAELYCPELNEKDKDTDTKDTKNEKRADTKTKKTA